MPRTRNPYPAEFREQIVALARGGRSFEELARELEPCAATILGWIKQADRGGGRKTAAFSSARARWCVFFGGQRVLASSPALPSPPRTPLHFGHRCQA